MSPAPRLCPEHLTLQAISPVSLHLRQLADCGWLTAARPATPVPIPPGFTPEQAAVLQMQMQAIQPVLPTPEKKWYDRLADTILGDDPVQSSQNKYALVCAECFRHNGLVGSKQEWERMREYQRRFVRLDWWP